MSQSASQYAAFWSDVKRTGRLWTVKDDGGVSAPKTRTRQRAMPFWSTLSRVQRINCCVPAYKHFEPLELSWDEMRDIWLPDLKKSGILVGVNWSGKQATGYDVTPDDMLLAGTKIVDEQAES